MKFAVVVLCVVLVGCGRPAQSSAPANATASAPAPSPESSQQNPTRQSPRIVFLGDSLTAGLGLPIDQSYPSLIDKKLKERGYDLQVVNAGVSGDTSAGGLRRLEWSLEGDVKVLVVALGANDGLRGLPPSELKKNLTAILDRAKARGIPVVLAGMEAPPNNGIDYTREFRQVYTDLADDYDVRFVPFLLQGVAGDASLNQGDGIHPNARGAAIVADLVWKELEPVLPRRN
ncbi:MAG TPA: arylesterase [Vicinamibacterales bacterium]|nr:arylesterase [Vicinamibacterales bacterium]